MLECRLELYNSEWESKVRGLELEDAQKDFVFSPSAALDFFKLGNSCFAVIIFHKEEPIGFFILHRSKEAQEYTNNLNTIFLRSFSIDRNHQSQGFGSAAMGILPQFIRENVPEIEEIILTVHEKNVPAMKLYEKSGFTCNGKTKEGRKGIEHVMLFLLKPETNEVEKPDYKYGSL
jgi:RimJ/RimL family protein N-acetyltransferase